MEIATYEAGGDLAEVGAVKRGKCPDFLTERKDGEFMLVGSLCKWVEFKLETKEKIAIALIFQRLSLFVCYACHKYLALHP